VKSLEKIIFCFPNSDFGSNFSLKVQLFRDENHPKSEFGMEIFICMIFFAQPLKIVVVHIKNENIQNNGYAMPPKNDINSLVFYHGTKANLNPGDLIEPGFNSNYGKRKKASFVYLTATLDAAIWGAELALGDGPGRIYIVEPTGPIEDDPNLTDKKFPGNPTKSYRSRSPLRVTGEVTDWQGHTPEQLKAMKDHLEQLKQMGIEAIEDDE
jgi:hypothetical protein